MAFAAVMFGGLGTPFFFVALIFALMGIVGGVIAIPKPKIAGILMLIGGIGSIICIGPALFVLGGVLLIPGGILALIAARKPQSA